MSVDDIRLILSDVLLGLVTLLVLYWPLIYENKK